MIQRLSEFMLHPEALRFRTPEEIGTIAQNAEGLEISEIGTSREGRPIYGFEFGEGSRHVSVVAGCHADEPIGPMTAQCLHWHIRAQFPDLHRNFRFHVVPNINPDGAERNRVWFSDPLEIHTFLNHVIRELPGDDIEFGFGDDGDERPENRAAMDFLRPHGPYVAHFSLHGLGTAEGAWCLICKEWTEKAAGFMDAFAHFCTTLDFPQHDIDRKGDKGFVRIGKGYTTTPHSVPMKQFFLDKNDPETAAKFKPTSMQFVQSLGGDPLCIVSELPLFYIGKKSPDLNHLTTTEVKNAITEIRAKHSPLEAKHFEDVYRDFDIKPTPLDLQIRLQTGMILLALQEVLNHS
jgi:hypothetical protein